jgi:hypothetical protein
MRLNANIALVVSNESPSLINSLLKRKIRIMHSVLTLILIGAIMLGAGIIIWEIKTPTAGQSPLALTLILIFLGLEDALMILSYVLLFKQLHKYFNDYLSSEKNQLLTVFGIILLSILVQTLYLLAEVNSFFCHSFAL